MYLECAAPGVGDASVSKLAIVAAMLLALSPAQAPARDLALPEAESLLVRNNRELQAARRGMESADAQRVIAGARPNATFSVNAASINDANTIDNQRRGADTVFRIDQPFERGKKRELRLDAAGGLQRAARNDYLDVLRQQLAVLQGAYYDLKLAQERAQTLAENAQLFAGTLNAAERRLKAGDLAPADVAKVQVDFERAQNDARGAQADLARAQIALAYLLALEAEGVERFEGSLLGAANRSAQASEFAFSRGAISVLEVLDARRTLRAVRLEALGARADYAKALGAWRAAQASVQSLDAR